MEVVLHGHTWEIWAGNYIEHTKKLRSTATCLSRWDLDIPEQDNFVLLAGWWRKVCQTTNTGERYVSVHAGTVDGFVEMRELVFSSSTKNMEYHVEMNKENFMVRFENQRLRNLQVSKVVFFICFISPSSPLSQCHVINQSDKEILWDMTTEL